MNQEITTRLYKSIDAVDNQPSYFLLRYVNGNVTHHLVLRRTFGMINSDSDAIKILGARRDVEHLSPTYCYPRSCDMINPELIAEWGE